MKEKRLLTVTGLFSMILTLIALLSLVDDAKPASPPGAKTLMVGALFSLTGPAAPAVKQGKDGAILAAEWINGKGGITIKGQRYVIEVVAEDDKSSPDAAVAATNKLVHKDKVKFIVGPVVPQCGIVMAPITEEAKVLRCNVNGTGTQAEINPDLRYTFATYKNINHIAPAYDYFVENYPKAKRMAIIGPNDPGGQGAAPVSQKEAKKRGLEVVFTELYPFGTEDFYPMLTKALDQKPDAIDMTVGITPWFAGIIKQARQLGFKGPMFTSCPTGDIYLLRNIVGKDFAYDMFFMEPDLKSPKMTPIIKEIRKRVQDKYAIEAQYAHAAGWEALWVTMQAIEAAQSLDTTLVAQAWEKMKSIETISGKGRMGGLDTFGINHVIIKPVPVTRLKNGEVEFVKFIIY
jgi:branched-chain amino acid transport system substrate-binding protein